MKKLIVGVIMAVIILTGCGAKTNDDFVKYSQDFYVQMFKNGEQSAKVNEMYEEYTESYAGFKDDELYEAIDGMYHGLANGTATDYQLQAMHILDARY